MRALDRGGKAHVRLSATSAHEPDGEKATVDICPYVRHRAAIFVGGTFTAKTNPEPDNFFERLNNGSYGWTGHPLQMYATLACYGRATGDELPSSDPCDFKKEGASALTKGSIILKECPVAVSITPEFEVAFSGFNDWKYYGNCRYGNITCLIEHAKNTDRATKGHIDNKVFPAPYCTLPKDHEGNNEHGVFNREIQEFLGGKLTGESGNRWIDYGSEVCSINPSSYYIINDLKIESYNGTSETKKFQSDKFKWLMLYWCNNCVYYHVYGLLGNGTYPASNTSEVGKVTIKYKKSTIEDQSEHNDVEIRHIIYTFDWSSNDPFSYSEYTWGASSPWWHASSINNPIYIEHLNQ